MSWDILYKNMPSLLNVFFDESLDILLMKMSLYILYKNMISPLNEFWDDSSDVLIEKCLGPFLPIALLYQ